MIRRSNRGIGQALIAHAMLQCGATHLWVLEKNTRAISFYERRHFLPTGRRQLEEGTTEYLIELRRQTH